MPQNIASQRTALNPLFGAKAASVKSAAPVVENIEKFVQRRPNSLKNVTNFAKIEGDKDQQIGTVGFRFEHGGLTYETRFMSDDGNHDIAEFKILVPLESPFLRPAEPVKRSEKIYMLSVIHHSADTTWLRAPLSRLEDACFDDKNGKVEPVVPHPIHTNFLTPVKLFAHVGLSFPSNESYKDEPDAVLKAFEYWDAQRRYVMDVSHYPQIDFYTSKPKESMIKSQPMHRKMAEDMLREIRLAAQREMDIAMYIGTKNFSENVDFAIKRLLSIEKPHRGYPAP